MSSGTKSTDDVWKRAEIESPCVKLCTIHPDAEICVGCLRTVAEIMNWSKISPQERHAVMDELPGRRSRITKRRGGRSARLAGT